MSEQNNISRRYVVTMFSYPSGDLHMGHAKTYTIGDIISRFARLRGNDVLHPVGWDSFGLPAENAALKRNLDPKSWTYDNINVQADSFHKLGISCDWGTRLHTSDPEYYRWTQWLFIRMYEHDLAYRDQAPVNWCPVDQTVLANEQVVEGRCERCGAEVEARQLTQWFFRTTRYAQQLLDDMKQLEGNWPSDALAMQRNWIANLHDWLVSRQRYWGTPIPIIHCQTCGEVPVPDDQLPVRLPESGYQLRSADGRSPLASADEWVQVDCPSCGGAARRDTDTMDTFVDSSWYFLRYPNPNYVDGPFDPKGVERWLPVNEYIGGKGLENSHLIYARFLTKALYDMGFVHFTEPFTRVTTVGSVLMDGKAMSKSLGNLVKLQDQMEQYGPDAVRVTMAFAGPPSDNTDWADVSPSGAVKWLSRVSRLVDEVSVSASEATAEDSTLHRAVQRLIAEITELMEGKRFNVAIARLMELTSLLGKAVNSRSSTEDSAVRAGTEALVCMMSCFAPYTAEAAWQRLGHQLPICDWPRFNATLVVNKTTMCVVQVAGKVRDRFEVSPMIAANELRELALQSGRVQQALNGMKIGRVIIKAPSLVNFVPDQGE